MDEMKLESLKARIRRADYVVDPEAVAEAILRRALAARDQSRGEAAGDGNRRCSGLGLASDDVLEAR